MRSLSMASLRDWIWLLSWLPSLVVTEAEITCTLHGEAFWWELHKGGFSP